MAALTDKANAKLNERRDRLSRLVRDAQAETLAIADVQSSASSVDQLEKRLADAQLTLQRSRDRYAAIKKAVR